MTNPLAETASNPPEASRRVQALAIAAMVGGTAMLAVSYFGPTNGDAGVFAKYAIALAPMAAVEAWGARRGKMAWAAAGVALVIGWGGAAFMLAR